MPHAPDIGMATLKVFISYSRLDRVFAERLVAALEARGLAPRIDIRDLPKLEDWRRELLGFIREADAVVFIISPHSVSSPVCAWEIAQVAALNKRLAPIVLEPVTDDRIPSEVTKINYIFFSAPGDFEAQADALAAALEINLEWVKEHTRLGELARRWDDRKRDKVLLLRGRELEDAQRWIAMHPRGAPEATALHRDFIVRSRRGAVRRQRLLLVGSLALALVGFGLAAVALWQRHQAVEQTERANQNFVAAKAAADGLINDLAKSLRNVRGVSQETTHTLLTAANGVMEKLIANSPPTPQLLLSQIELYYQFELTYWYVGDVSNALESARRSLSLTDNMLRGAVDADLRNRLLAHRYEVLIEQGNILRVMGSVEDSLSSFRAGLEAAEGLLTAADKDDKQAALKLTMAHGRIGDVMRTLRRFEEADSEYRMAERIALQHLQATPDDPDWMLDLSWSYNRLADNLLRVTNHEGLMTVADDRTPAQRGNPNLSAALSFYAQSADLRRRLMMVRGRDSRNLRDVIWSMTLHGMALLATDAGKALMALDEALTEVGRALDVDPKNTELKRYQANAYNFHGDALLISGKLGAAFDDYSRGLEIRQKLSDADPNNARWRRDLFYTLKRMVALHRIADDNATAEHYLARAIEIGDQVRLKFPTDNVLASAIDELKASRTPSDASGVPVEKPPNKCCERPH